MWRGTWIIEKTQALFSLLIKNHSLDTVSKNHIWQHRKRSKDTQNAHNEVPFLSNWFVSSWHSKSHYPSDSLSNLSKSLALQQYLLLQILVTGKQHLSECP